MPIAHAQNAMQAPPSSFNKDSASERDEDHLPAARQVAPKQGASQRFKPGCEVASQKKSVQRLTLTRDALAEHVATLPYDVLNVLEAAALLRCHPKTLKIKAAEWGVPHRRQGSQLRFSKQQLVEWVQGRETYSSPNLVPMKATA